MNLNLDYGMVLPASSDLFSVVDWVVPLRSS